jgi:hypothetical protein
MQTRQLLATGVMTIVAFGAFTFMPAAANSSGASADSASIAPASLNPPETPQALVWDMAYGQRTPPVAAAEEESTPVATSNPQDLSLG